MNKEQTYQYLRDHNVAFEATEHAAVYNMEELAAIRLPHPDGLRPAAVHGGKYCAETETVTLPTLCGTAQVVLEF